MPIPTDTLYRMSRLNRWFALSSLSLLVSLVWLIWEDYDRPWRGFQDDYMVVQAALAHLDYLNTQTESYRAKVADARQGVADARAAVVGRAQERAELEEELRSLNDQHDGIKITFGNAEALLQVTRNDYEVARSTYGSDSPEGKAAWERLQQEEEHTAELRVEKDRIQDGQSSIRRKLKEIDLPVVEAEKRLVELEKVAADAARNEDQYSNVLVKSVINAPLLDFTAPKGTPSRHEVRQLVLPNVRQQLNYLETYTTDRCTTCHLAIDDENFSREILARRFERALPAVNEALQRRGKDALPFPPVPELAGDEPPELTEGEVTEFWDYLGDDQQRTYFAQLLERINAYLAQAGRKQIALAQPLLAHPNLDLFVHADSPHGKSKVGCTVCHEGNPQETDFVQAAHTPVTHEQEEEWKAKYYVTAAFVPNVTFATVEHYWDYPMLPPKYAEAGCAKCHHEIADIADFRGESQARRLNLGRYLFVNSGCINCHNVEGLGDSRRVGPDLRRIASKLSRDFVEPWIFNPKKFRPSTWMPHFFGQENNRPGSENADDTEPVLRTEIEVSAMAHYLFTLSDAYEPLPVPEGLSGDVERGRKLFIDVGCLACHANVAEFGREMIVSDLRSRQGRSRKVAEALYDEMNYVDRADYMMRHLPTDRDTVFEPESIEGRPIFTRFGPELSSIGSKVSREWLFSWLKEPTHFDEHTKMPSLHLTDQEALDIAEYLAALKANDVFDARRFPSDEAHRQMGDELVFQILRSQNSARRSRAIMSDEGGELSAMLARLLSTSIGEAEAESKVARLDLDDKKMLFLGSKMITHYGCYACHTIRGFETAIRPGTELTAWGSKPLSQLDFGFYDSAFNSVRESKEEVYGHLYPPQAEDLIYWGHGHNPEVHITHTRAAFAKHKLLNPRIWDREKIKRPYDKLKMPNFYFIEQQADALVTFLLSRRPALVNDSLKVNYDSTFAGPIARGRHLTRELNCIGCHKIEDNASTVHQYFTEKIGGEETFDEVNAPPWLRGEGSKVQYYWLFGFLHNVETLRPWLKVRMPTFSLSDDETRTLVEYFAAISQYESRTLRDHIEAIDDYLAKAQAALEEQGPDAAPDAGQWFTSDALRDTASYLAAYAVQNRLVTRYDVDPNNDMEDLEEAYATVLDKVRFTADLFDVPFPFADKPRPLVNEERFALGEKLFYELQCLACHVFGDPNMEGSNRNPSAPNLNLTHKRLRQEWTHQWLQEPPAMQPGTKMPQWFPGGDSAFSDYPEEDRTELEGLYGSTGEEQMQLLMDFVYNAGVKNYTAVQPGGLGAASAPVTDMGDEEGEEEEEDEEGEEE